MLSGLPDQSYMYDVLEKRSTTMDLKKSRKKEIVSSVEAMINRKMSIKTEKPGLPSNPEKNAKPWNHEKPQQQRKRLCYTCNEEGHFSRHCPKHEDTNQKKHRSKTRSLN